MNGADAGLIGPKVMAADNDVVRKDLRGIANGPVHTKAVRRAEGDAVHERELVGIVTTALNVNGGRTQSELVARVQLEERIGTGDVQLTLIQSVSVTGAVVVTTPSIVALADVRKAIEMFRQVNVEILGVVENMSYFNCPHCKGRIDVFGHGEGQHMAKSFGVPFLGEIEIDPQIRIGGDTGKPVASLGEDAPGSKSIYAMARNVVARLDVVNESASAPVVQIL